MNAASHAARRTAFEHWFGVSYAQGQVLALLFQAGGAFLSTAQIAVMEGSTHENVMVRINRLRQAMEAEAIDTVRGDGYRLTEVGLAECRQAIAEFAQSLAAE
jgi:DNA-binding response OmpR family regulator